jgi:ABC-2 type transport system permease protein
MTVTVPPADAADTGAFVPPAESAFRNFPGYRQIVRGRIQMSFTYRQNSFFLLALVVVQIFVLRRVWTALYRGHSTSGQLNLHALIVYLTIANLQTWVLQDPSVSFYMYERIREGIVAFDLVRPTGFVSQMFAHLVGSGIASLLFILPAVPIVVFAGSLGAPASASAGLLYLLSLLAGYVIALLLTLMLGMIAFWTMETQGLTMLYLLVNSFFGGALVPLTLFPHGLEILAKLLPFQATVYTPVGIYVGQIRSGREAAAAIGVQLVWVVVLALGSLAMWRRALHRVVVQGG